MERETRYTIASNAGLAITSSRIRSYYNELQKATTLDELISLRQKMQREGYILQGFQFVGSVEGGSVSVRDGEKTFHFEKENTPVPKDASDQLVKALNEKWAESAQRRLNDRSFEALKSSILQGLSSASQAVNEKAGQKRSRGLTAKVFSHFFSFGKGKGGMNFLIGLLMMPVLLQVVLPLTLAVDIPRSIIRLVSNSRRSSMASKIEKSAIENAEEMQQKERERKVELEQFKEESERQKEEMDEKQDEEEQQNEDKEQGEEEAEEQEKEENLEEEVETELSEEDLTEIKQEIEDARSEREQEQESEEQHTAQEAEETMILDEERPQDLRGLPEEELEKEEEIEKDKDAQKGKDAEKAEVLTKREEVLVTREIMDTSSSGSIRGLSQEAHNELNRISDLQKEMGIKDSIGLDLYKKSIDDCEKAVGAEPNQAAAASRNLKAMVDDLRLERIELEGQSRLSGKDLRKVREDRVNSTAKSVGESLKNMEGKKISSIPAQDSKGHLYTGVNQLILQQSMMQKGHGTCVFLTPSEMKDKGLEPISGAKGEKIFVNRNGKLAQMNVFNLDELQKDGIKYRDTKEYGTLLSIFAKKEASIDKKAAERKYMNTMLSFANERNSPLLNSLARIMSGLGCYALSQEETNALLEGRGLSSLPKGTYVIINGTRQDGELSPKDMFNLLEEADKASIASVTYGKCDKMGIDIGKAIDEEMEQEQGYGEEKDKEEGQDKEKDNENGKENNNDNDYSNDAGMEM